MMWGTSTWSLDGVHPTAKLGPFDDRWMVAYPRGLIIPSLAEPPSRRTMRCPNSLRFRLSCRISPGQRAKRGSKIVP